MSDFETQIKNLEEKHKELLRAFKSLNTKVNNNFERNNERFTKVENSVQLQEKKIYEVEQQNTVSIKDLESRKAIVDNDLKTIEEKLSAVNIEITKMTEKHLKSSGHTVENAGPEPQVINLHTCKKCCEHFESLKLLKTHMRSEHKSFQKCSDCDKSFANGIELEMHMSEHHKVKGFSCDKCDSKFLMKWRLNKHKMIHEKVKIRNCHYFNSDKFCPFSKIGCKFLHQYSEECKYGNMCKMDKCQYRHEKDQQLYSNGSSSMNCDEL